MGALPDRFSCNILSREERCARCIFSQLAKGSLFLAIDDGIFFFFFPSVKRKGVAFVSVLFLRVLIAVVFFLFLV